MASVATVLPPPKMHPDSTYTFATLPRALVLQRRKIRDYSKADDSQYRQGVGTNYRRNPGRGKPAPWATWSTTVPSELNEPAVSERPQARIAVPPTTRRPDQQYRRNRTTSSSVAPVEGRRHLEVQTELYLEELTDAVEEVDAICQTDELLERAPAFAFVPAKTGSDAATQVDESDLYDFEMESQPVLELLVGKTVQHALVEVLQEEDVADIKRQQRRFQQLRQAYLAGEEWLKEQEKKLFDSHKGPHVNGKKDDVQVLNTLHLTHAWGFVHDPIAKDLERAFLPWVLDEVEGEINQSNEKAHKSSKDGLNSVD